MDKLEIPTLTRESTNAIPVKTAMEELDVIADLESQFDETVIDKEGDLKYEYLDPEIDRGLCNEIYQEKLKEVKGFVAINCNNLEGTKALLLRKYRDEFKGRPSDDMEKIEAREMLTNIFGDDFFKTNELITTGATIEEIKG